MSVKRELTRDRPAKVPYRRKTERPYVFVMGRVRQPRGEQIYSFRKSIGLSRSALARLMYVSLPSILWWETGKIEPKNLAWHSFIRVRRNYQQKLRRAGKDLDGGPVMGEK